MTDIELDRIVLYVADLAEPLMDCFQYNGSEGEKLIDFVCKDEHAADGVLDVFQISGARAEEVAKLINAVLNLFRLLK